VLDQDIMSDLCDQPFIRLSGKYLQKQSDALKRQFEGCRLAEDTEFIHRARVASRRLREGLRVFKSCYRPEQIRRWSRSIRRLTKSLGAARDADVQINFIRTVLKDLDNPGVRVGIDILLRRLEQHRELLQPEVMQSLDRLEDSEVLQEIRTACHKVLTKSSSRKSKRANSGLSKSKRFINKRLRTVIDDQDCLDDPSDTVGHHQMRIDAKRLRYAAEICRPLFNGKLDPFVRQARRLQKKLGDLHDFDVWLETLDQFARSEQQRIEESGGGERSFEEIRQGIDYLVTHINSERCKSFERVIKAWRKWCNPPGSL